MDILSYAGLRRRANVSSSADSIPSLKVTKPLLCNLASSGCCNQDVNVVAGAYIDDPLLSVICAMECLDSQSIVRRRGGASGFKVYDTTYYRCGICCLWTVPAGASCVQFQIWGAGGGTSSVCCCGGSPFGPSGAYATVTIPAVPGCSYTLYAGCAYCCYASQTTAGYGTSGTSYVSGYGITNFCALSGQSAQCAWGSSGVWNSNWPSVNNIGPQSCSGWNFCWDGTQDTTCREYEYSKCAGFYGTATGSTVYGIRGMNPRLYVDTATLHTGWTQAAPIMGYITQSMCRMDWSCMLSPGACGGCSSSILFGVQGGLMLVPGQGGWATPICSALNATTYTGDAGRGGMVCVSWY